MAPPADLDPHLLVLQGRVAFLRTEHESLIERERVLRAQRLAASAESMKQQANKTFRELETARKKLAAYISRKQRR